MTIVDRIRELFGGKQPGADVATMGGAVAAGSGEREPAGSEPQSDWSGGGDSGGGGSDSGGGGGDGGGGGG